MLAATNDLQRMIGRRFHLRRQRHDGGSPLTQQTATRSTHRQGVYATKTSEPNAGSSVKAAGQNSYNERSYDGPASPHARRPPSPNRSASRENRKAGDRT